MAALKLLRWLATAGLVLVALIQLGAGNWFGGLAIGLAASTLWWVPKIARAPKTAKAHMKSNPEFEPAYAHEHIALDSKRDLLWIRDPAIGERYVGRTDLLSWRTNHDWNNGTFRQRIELQLRDVANPLWNVLFQRHSDTWIKTSKKNAEERDEWFARLQAWNRSPPAAKAATAPLRDFRISLHESYYESDDEKHRATYLAAFDMGCNAEGFDQKASWERLGGEYPGPSPELLKHRSEQAQNG